MALAAHLCCQRTCNQGGVGRTSRDILRMCISRLMGMYHGAPAAEITPETSLAVCGMCSSIFIFLFQPLCLLMSLLATVMGGTSIQQDYDDGRRARQQGCTSGTTLITQMSAIHGLTRQYGSLGRSLALHGSAEQQTPRRLLER